MTGLYQNATMAVEYSTLDVYHTNTTTDANMFTNMHNDTLLIDQPKMTLEQLNREMKVAVLPVTIMIGLESVVGFVGNVLILLIYSRRYKHCNFRYFVLCMAVIDLTSCVTTLPGEIISQLNWYDYEHGWICKAKSYFNVFTAWGSALTLLLLAFDRYRKICHPLGWQIQPSFALKLCLVGILISAFVSIPITVLWGKQTYVYQQHGVNITVSICEKSTNYADAIYPFIYVACTYIVPIGLMILTICVLNALIGRKLFCRMMEIRREVVIFAESPSRAARKRSDGSCETSGDATPSESSEIECTTTTQRGVTRQKSVVKVKYVQRSKRKTSYESQSGSDCCSSPVSNGPCTVSEIVDEKSVGRFSQVTEINVETVEVKTKGNGEIYTEKPTNKKTTNNIVMSILTSPKTRAKFRIGKRTHTSESVSSVESINSRCDAYKESATFRRKRKTMIMLVLTSVFVVTMSLYVGLLSAVAGTEGVLKSTTDSQKVIFFFFWRLYFVNCVINPILYGFMDPRFRNGLKVLFTSLKCMLTKCRSSA